MREPQSPEARLRELIARLRNPRKLSRATRLLIADDIEALAASARLSALPADPPRLDDQYLHHLREAAYDWGIEPFEGEPNVARRAAILFGRSVVTLIDEVRRSRASLPAQEETP